MAKLRIAPMFTGPVLVLAACQAASASMPAAATPTPSPRPLLTEDYARIGPLSPMPPQGTRATPTTAPHTVLGPTPSPTHPLFRYPTPTGSPIPPIRHIDHGTQVTLHEIHMIDAESGWAFGGDLSSETHLLRTSDAGKTWRDVSPPVQGPEWGAFLDASGTFLDSQKARVVFYLPYPVRGPVQSLLIWKTDDGGQTWSSTNAGDVYFIGLEWLSALVRFVDPDRGWIMIRHQRNGKVNDPVDLLATVDGGETWEWISDYRSETLASCVKSGVTFGSALVGFATLEECPNDVPVPVLEWTRDGGSTWEQARLPMPKDSADLTDCGTRSPQFVSASRAVVGASCRTGEGGGRVSLLFSTDDSGSTWKSLAYPGGDLLFIDSQTGWAVDHNIYRTTDAGEHWEKVKTVSWSGQFSFISPSLGWAVAHGDGTEALVRTLDGGSTWLLLKPFIGD